MIQSEGSTLVTFEGRTTRVEPFLRKALDDMENEVHKNDDGVIIIDGRTGSGKSIMAQTIGWYLSKGKITLKEIVFLPDDFEERINNSPKYGVVIYDEAYLGLAARDAMSHYNRKLIRLLNTCRKKNLFLILCIPSVFDIDKRLPFDRAKFMIHIEKMTPEKRYYYYYDRFRLSDLYRMGKEWRSYRVVKSNFWGSSADFYAVDRKEYEEKNDKDVRKFLADEDMKLRTSESIKTKDMVLAKALRMIKDDKGFNIDTMGHLFNVDPSTMGKYLKVLDKNQQIWDTSPEFRLSEAGKIKNNTPSIELDDEYGTEPTE